MVIIEGLLETCKKIVRRLDLQDPGLCPNVCEWALKQQGESCKILRNAGEFLPEIKGTHDARVIESFQKHTRISYPNKYHVKLSGCRITGRDGFLRLNDGRYALETGWHDFMIQKNPAYFQRRLFSRQRVRKLSGEYYSLMGVWCREHYHWLHDQIMGLFLIRERLADHVKFIIPDQLKKYQLQALDKVGIPDERRVIYDGSEIFEPEILHFSGPNIQTGFDEPESVEWFLRAMIPRQSAPIVGRRIYISRKNAKFRRIVNEDELSFLLEQEGFEKIVIGDEMELEERIGIFSEASSVVSVHGAALVNLMYCRPETSVLEILNRLIFVRITGSCPWLRNLIIILLWVKQCRRVFLRILILNFQWRLSLVTFAFRIH
ncbi:MAG: glycosyltransferase family 61 protein [Verrucomicrobiota bacterium]|nr:glycosyltransferase family 61 protein [Verrucomicrobiota bacterium]